MKKMRSIGAKLCGIAGGFFLLVQPAFATLVDADWQAPGDAHLLFDTDTGLQWLDLSVTANQSYNYVTSNFGPGQIYEGFRVATQTEVIEMWSHVGIINYEREWTVGQYSEVRDLVTRLGPTVMIEPGLFPVATHTIGMINAGPVLSADERWAMELTYAPDGESTRTSANFYTWNVNTADDHYSTYLVQAVPLPAGIWLLISGAVGMGMLLLPREKRCKQTGLC